MSQKNKKVRKLKVNDAYKKICVYYIVYYIVFFMLGKNIYADWVMST